MEYGKHLTRFELAVLAQIQGMLEVLIGYHMEFNALTHDIPEEYKRRIAELFNLLSHQAVAYTLNGTDQAESELIAYLLEQVGEIGRH